MPAVMIAPPSTTCPTPITAAPPTITTTECLGLPSRAPPPESTLPVPNERNYRWAELMKHVRRPQQIVANMSASNPPA
jgi:hypothetical protein